MVLLISVLNDVENFMFSHISFVKLILVDYNMIGGLDDD